MKAGLRLLIVAVGSLGVAVPAAAHHAFGGEFDANRPVLLRGKVTRVQWVNPHVWIHVEITNDDGDAEEWMVEGGSPNTLIRLGLSGDSIEIGTEVIVDGYQARDPTLKRANGRNITLADGRQLLLGSSLRQGSDPE
jgi:Family of unknown function (DUF6152)